MPNESSSPPKPKRVVVAKESGQYVGRESEDPHSRPPPAAFRRAAEADSEEETVKRRNTASIKITSAAGKEEGRESYEPRLRARSTATPSGSTRS